MASGNKKDEVVGTEHYYHVDVVEISTNISAFDHIYGELGLSILGRDDNGLLCFKVIEDSDAEFVSFGGVFVDTKTFNIALGLFPNKNEYIYYGNVLEHFSAYFLAGIDLSVYDDDCVRDVLLLVIEQCKIDSNRFFKIGHKLVRECFRDHRLNNSEKYDSILLKLVKDHNDSRYVSGLEELWKSEYFQTKLLYFLNFFMNKYRDAEKTAKTYFQNFICEKSSDRVQSNKDIDYLYSEKIPNLEALYRIYLSLGIPGVFLRALKSYGLGVKQRMAITNNRIKREIDLIPIFSILSSFAYIDSSTDIYPTVLAYNLMDMLKGKKKENLLIFAIQIMKDTGNASLVQNILSMFSVDEILKEEGVELKNFILSLERYYGKYMNLIDWGCCYSRDVLSSQYSFIAFSPSMIESSGRVFEDVSNTILNKFS